MSGIEIGNIRDTKDSAKTVLELLRQDAEVSGAPDMYIAGNPDSSMAVLYQRFQFRKSFDSYTAAWIDGDLTGFMRTKPWHPVDQIPFTSGKERKELEQFSRTPFADFDPRNALHVSRLIIDYSLDEQVQAQIADRLLDTAADKARYVGARALTMTFHEHDPVQRVAREHDFQFTGRAGEVPTLPGVIQRLYRKPLD